MKRRIWGMILAVCAACAMLALGGCESYEPESSEADAAAYYQDKYGERARVAESHGLGNYSLFGYSYSGMEYIMSDGVSVTYADDEGIYRDNRQSTEIQQVASAFAERELAGIPGVVEPAALTSVGDTLSYETYEGTGVCWHARYDGDLEAFLQEERPPLVLESFHSGDRHEEGRFSYNIACDFDHAQEAEDALLALSQYFDIRRVGLAVIDPQAFKQGESSLFDDAVHYTVAFEGEGGSAVKAVRFKPAFVPLMEGATISSAVGGVTLSAGDVAFSKESGFCKCAISGAAAQQPQMAYYIRNDGPLGITAVLGLDKFRVVCEAHEHRSWCSLADGATYYLGDPDDIAPRAEVESVSADKVVIRYHTFFKDGIKRVKFRAIGMGQRQGSSNYESMAFKGRIIEETEDGWRCEIVIPPHAKPDNELALQFTYNDDKDVSVQIMQDVQL